MDIRINMKKSKHISILLIAAIIAISGCTAIFIGKSKTVDIDVKENVSIDSVNVGKPLIKKDIIK